MTAPIQRSEVYYRERAARGVTYQEEIRAIEREHRVSLNDMREYSRWRHRVRARWEVMAMLRARNWSLPRIGTFMNRDHTTVMYVLAERRRRMELMAQGTQAGVRAEMAG